MRSRAIIISVSLKLYNLSTRRLLTKFYQYLMRFMDHSFVRITFNSNGIAKFWWCQAQRKNYYFSIIYGSAAEWWKCLLVFGSCQCYDSITNSVGIPIDDGCGCGGDGCLRVFLFNHTPLYWNSPCLSSSSAVAVARMTTTLVSSDVVLLFSKRLTYIIYSLLHWMRRPRNRIQLLVASAMNVNSVHIVCSSVVIWYWIQFTLTPIWHSLALILNLLMLLWHKMHFGLHEFIRKRHRAVLTAQILWPKNHLSSLLMSIHRVNENPKSYFLEFRMVGIPFVRSVVIGMHTTTGSNPWIIPHRITSFDSIWFGWLVVCAVWCVFSACFISRNDKIPLGSEIAMCET